MYHLIVRYHTPHHLRPVCVYVCLQSVCIFALRKQENPVMDPRPWIHYSHSTQGFPPIHWQSLTNPQWPRLLIPSSSLNYHMPIKKATDNGSTASWIHFPHRDHEHPGKFSQQRRYSPPPVFPGLLLYTTPSSCPLSLRHLSTSYAPRGKFRIERRVL